MLGCLAAPWKQHLGLGSSFNASFSASTSFWIKMGLCAGSARPLRVEGRLCGCPGDRLLPNTHHIQDVISAAIPTGFKNLQLRAPGCCPVEAGEVPLLCPVMRLFCSSPSRGRLDKAGLHGRALGSHEFLLELKQPLWMRLRAGILPLKWGWV